LSLLRRASAQLRRCHVSALANGAQCRRRLLPGWLRAAGEDSGRSSGRIFGGDRASGSHQPGFAEAQSRRLLVSIMAFDARL